MTDDIVYCKTLDFPPMPDYLVQQALSIIADQSNYYIFHKASTLVKNANGSDIPVSEYRRYHVSPDIFDWVASTVPVKLSSNVDYKKIGIQIFVPVKLPSKYRKIERPAFRSVGNLTLHAGHPHTDGPRGPYVLNYQIDTGGDNVLTKWYHEVDQPLVRQSSITLNSFQNLNEVHSEHIAQGTWFCMPVRVLHSVVNLERPRISLSIGLDGPM